MKTRPTRFGLISLALLAALGAGRAALGVKKAPSHTHPKAAAMAAPVRLNLSVEKGTMITDAPGQSHVSWAALAGTEPVHPGDLLRYQVKAENRGAVAVKNLVVTQPVPTGTVYQAHSAEGDAADDAQVTYSLDGKAFSEQPVQTETGADGVAQTHPAAPETYVALRWRFPALAAKSAKAVTYQVQVR